MPPADCSWIRLVKWFHTGWFRYILRLIANWLPLYTLRSQNFGPSHRPAFACWVPFVLCVLTSSAFWLQETGRGRFTFGQQTCLFRVCRRDKDSLDIANSSEGWLTCLVTLSSGLPRLSPHCLIKPAPWLHSLQLGQILYFYNREVNVRVLMNLTECWCRFASWQDFGLLLLWQLTYWQSCCLFPSQNYTF